LNAFSRDLSVANKALKSASEPVELFRASEMYLMRVRQETKSPAEKLNDISSQSQALANGLGARKRSYRGSRYVFE
jgi:hypothetical protein